MSTYLAKYVKALKNGKLIRPSNCELCGKDCKPEGHHPDYKKPLIVVWACRACHRKLPSGVNKPKRAKNLKRRVVHIELPIRMWSKFLHWCVDNGYGNLTEGIKGLIRNVCS